MLSNSVPRQPRPTRIQGAEFLWIGAGEVKAATSKPRRWSPATTALSSFWLESHFPHSDLVPCREQAEPSFGSSRRDWPLVEGFSCAVRPANNATLPGTKDPPGCSPSLSPCVRPRVLTGQSLRHLALVVRGWPMQTESFSHYIFCPAPPAAREQKPAEHPKSCPSRNESSPSPTRTHCVAVHPPASWWCVCGWPLSLLSGILELVLPLTWCSSSHPPPTTWKLRGRVVVD